MNKFVETNKENNMNTFRLFRTKYSTGIIEGKDIVYEIVSTTKDEALQNIRNFYLMMHDSKYHIRDFLHNINEGKYGVNFMSKIATPPHYSDHAQGDILLIAR